MSIFRKKTASLAPTSSSAQSQESRPIRQTTTARRAVSAAQRHTDVDYTGRSRRPGENIGIARLLEAYDDYPVVVSSLEKTTERLELTEEQVRQAEDRVNTLETELSDEKKGREDDGIAAREAMASAEKAREKKIRGELQPKIDTLDIKVKDLTADRDKLKKELEGQRGEMRKWIDAMERLGIERRNAEEKEKKAIEDKKVVDGKLAELDKKVLDGLKGFLTPAAVAATDGTTTKTKDSKTVTDTETDTPAPKVSEGRARPKADDPWGRKDW